MSESCRAEDAALVFRALLSGSVWHSGRVGVEYRVHDCNLSYDIDASAVRSLVRQHLRDLRLAASRFDIPSDLVARTRESLGETLLRGAIADRFYKSRFKIWVLLSRILFSGHFSIRAKSTYARRVVREFLPYRKTSSNGQR